MNLNRTRNDDVSANCSESRGFWEPREEGRCKRDSTEQVVSKQTSLQDEQREPGEGTQHQTEGRGRWEPHSPRRGS